MSELLILRHASWNYVVNGRGVGLNDEGIKMARDLGPRLGPFDRVYASDYLRARQTAQLLTEDIPDCSILPLLNELDFPYIFPTPQDYTQAVFREHLDDIRDQIGDLYSTISRVRTTSRTLMISHRVLMIALYVRLGRGRIESNDWNVIDFDPLCGFRVWFNSEGQAKGAQIVNH